MPRLALIPLAVLLSIAVSASATPVTLSTDASPATATGPSSATTPFDLTTGSIDAGALVQTADSEQLAAQMLEFPTAVPLTAAGAPPIQAPYQQVTVDVDNVPEPSAFVLLAMGLLAFCLGIWRSDRYKAAAK